MMHPFGIDTGYFKATLKHPHNFDKLDLWKGTDKEVEFVLICMGSGEWIEPLANQYIEDCEKRNLPWGAWFFLYSHISSVTQAQKWCKIPTSPYFPACVDYEKSKKYGTIPNATQLLNAFKVFEDHEQREAMGYSRKELIDLHLATMQVQDLNARWWWLAQYGPNRMVEDTRDIILPKRMRRDRVIVHQTADKGAPPPGFTPAAQSQDWDRWIGTMSLGDFTHTKELPAEPWEGSPPVPSLSLEERVAALERVAHSH